jgi:hypothetical protein
MQRAQLLRQLVLDSHYVVDEQQVAAAILARGSMRHLVAATSFRNNLRLGGVRSFHPSKQVRSFLPCNLSVSSTGRGAASRRRLI